MNDWLHIKKLEMLVVKADYNHLLMNNLVSNTTLNKKLLISSKKALMKANIELDKEYFNNLFETLFKYSNQKSKKIKLIFLMDKAVATDSEGILSLDDDLETDLKEIKFNVPIF